MDSKNLDPAEWGSAEQISQKFGITRGTLYRLAQAGRISWAVFKTRPEAAKGIRLFNIQSIREFLEANITIK